VGGESDEWVKKALRTSRNPRRIALNLMQKLGNAVREEKPLEGMEEHHAEEHEHHKEHAHHHGHHDDDHENDEHIWLSLRCAATLCKSIADSLSALDAEHAAEYQANCREYTARLLALDREYAKAVEASSRRTLLFADRFPFRYLADDYGLTCFAAFSGCSSESEASFKTIAFLAAKANELKLPAVLVLEGRTHKIAETVVRTAGRKELRILVMDSLQSSTTRDAARGKSYLTAMEKNLEVLKKALDSNM
jgi:zinc transport system substrate-binding protein